MTRLLRDPLLRFVALGALLFAVYELRSGGRERLDPGHVVVTRGTIENMAVLFERTWQRPPTEDELTGLIETHVRDEILYREGLSLGLDRDDPVIRRRIRQMVELLVDNETGSTEPSEGDLQAYLAAHGTRFAIEPRYTFRQVYLDPKRHGPALDRTIERLVSELQRAGDSDAVDNLGDPTLLARRFDGVTTAEVATIFGQEFATALGVLRPARWEGPVRSGYGLHLVRVSERTEARTPPLGEVREHVEREWTRDHAAAARETFYRDLRRRYAVTIEDSRLAQNRDGGQPDGE